MKNLLKVNLSKLLVEFSHWPIPLGSFAWLFFREGSGQPGFWVVVKPLLCKWALGAGWTPTENIQHGRIFYPCDKNQLYVVIIRPNCSLPKEVPTNFSGL